MTTESEFYYVRDSEAPTLPPPRRETGVFHWLRVRDQKEADAS